MNLRKLIEVFDERKDEYKGHTTPIIGLIGEDLNAAIFTDYLKRRRGKKAEVLSFPIMMEPGQGGNKKLDRWIKAGNTLYQAEIKSWCSFQIGGFTLLLKASEPETKELAHEKWESELYEHYNGTQTFGKVSKVLAKMKIPDDLKKKYHK